MEELETLLSVTLGADDESRRAAEERLQECRKVAGFRRALALMALEPHRPVALRQLAAVLLKQSLSPDLVASVSNEEIEEIKALILQGLSDPTSKLRTAVSMVISQLVWTSKRRGEDWPALLLRLYQGMTGSDERDVYSCCKCLYMVCEELPHTDSYNLLPTIAPTIYSIVANGNLRSRTRTRAASVMLSCITAATLEKGEDRGSKVVKEAITELVGNWLHICQQVFSTLSIEAPDYRLPIELIRTLILLLQEFPKIVKEQVGSIFHVICKFLTDAAPVYERDVLRGDDGLDASSRSAGDEEDAFGMASDSESVSLEPMVIECIDFLKAVLDCHIGRVAKLMLRAAKAPDLLHLMVRYMQMKDADAFKAEHDANEYMADDEEAFRNTARNSAMDLLEDLAELSPMDTVTCLVSTVRTLAQQAGKEGGGGSSSTAEQDMCRLQEACMFALGAVSAPVMEEHRRVESLSSVKMSQKNNVLQATGLKPLVMEAIAHSCRCESVLLRLRGVWLATQYLDIIEPQAKLQLTQGCVENMNPSQPLVYRLFSCRALSALLPSLQPHLGDSSPMNDLVSRLLPHIAPLLALTSSDTIHQIADTISAVARVLRTQVPHSTQCIEDSSEPVQVMGMVLEVWARYPADSLTVEMGCEALTALLEGCADEWSLACLSRALFCRMAKVVEAGLATYGVCVLSTAIEVLEQTVRRMAPFCFQRPVNAPTTDAEGAPSTPPSEMELELRTFFPLLIHFLASTNDDELLLRGVALLRVMVRSCPLEEWHYPAWHLNGLDLLVDFLGKAFAREEEGGVRIVGVLISEVISHRGQYIHEKVIEGMLSAVLARLRAAQSEDLAQQLILIFVRLALVSMSAVVGFLQRHEVMAQFLKSWLTMHAKLGSMKLAKISGAALLKLLEHAVTADTSLFELKVDKEGGAEGEVEPLVPGLLRVVVTTVIDLQEAFEKGAEAGSEAATDYLDPSLYTLEDEEEEEEEGAEDEEGEHERGAMGGDEGGRRGQLAAEHLKALGRETRTGRVAMSEALKMMASGSQSSPFVDLEAYQGLVMEANEDDESEGSAADQAGDPLSSVDLKEALHEFVLKSGWLCSGELNALFNSMSPTEHRYLEGMFTPAPDGSQ